MTYEQQSEWAFYAWIAAGMACALVLSIIPS
jgi:hypothetical protein